MTPPINNANYELKSSDAALERANSMARSSGVIGCRVAVVPLAVVIGVLSTRVMAEPAAPIDQNIELRAQKYSFEPPPQQLMIEPEQAPSRNKPKESRSRDQKKQEPR